MTSDNGIMYCPVCGRTLEAANAEEVAIGEHRWYIFVHDDIDHSESDMKALESGVN